MLSLEVVVSETDEEISDFNIGGFVDLLRKIDKRESQDEWNKWKGGRDDSKSKQAQEICKGNQSQYAGF